MQNAVRNIAKRCLVALRLDMRKRTEDRRVLETIILPWLATKTNDVLFVGCDWYTFGYRRWFNPKAYWTLDFDPAMAPFGSRRHIVDSMESITRHFQPGSLDLIVCNGVLGWGLNDRANIEIAISGVVNVLRPGGFFLLGWNDIPARRPVELAEIEALTILSPAVIQPIGRSKVCIESCNRHTYNLFTKDLSTPTI